MNGGSPPYSAYRVRYREHPMTEIGTTLAFHKRPTKPNFSEDQTMKNTKLVIAVSIAIGATGVSHARTCNRIGNAIYCNDGTNYQRIGNTTYGSDGSTSQSIGNFHYNSDGSSSQQIGNFRYNSSGSSSQRIGNFIYRSDGTSCQIIGDSIYCQ